MILTFIYDTFAIKAFPYFETQTFMAQRLKVKRDEEKENYYIDILGGYGFKEHKGELRAHNIQAWKSLLEAQDRLKEAGFEISKEKGFALRSEERRVGKECRSRGWPYH